MPAAELNITIEQGATFTKTLTLRDADEEPLDLTGYTGRAEIRETPTSSEILATFTVTIPSPATGVVKWVLPASVSDDIDVSSGSDFTGVPYYYDMELEDEDGVITRILQGTARVIPNVTRGA